MRAILTDPRYTGRGVLRAARRDPVTGWTPAVVTPARTHPALVDDHDWWAAQLVSRRPPAALPDNPPLAAAALAAHERAARHAGQGARQQDARRQDTGQW